MTTLLFNITFSYVFPQFLKNKFKLSSTYIPLTFFYCILTKLNQKKQGFREGFENNREQGEKRKHIAYKNMNNKKFQNFLFYWYKFSTPPPTAKLFFCICAGIKMSQKSFLLFQNVSKNFLSSLYITRRTSRNLLKIFRKYKKIFLCFFSKLNIRYLNFFTISPTLLQRFLRFLYHVPTRILKNCYENFLKFLVKFW